MGVGKTGIKFGFLGIAIAILLGCATVPKQVENQLASKKWQVFYKTKDFSITKADFEKDVFSKVRPSDEGERSKLKQLKKDFGFNFDTSETLKFGQVKSCEVLKTDLINHIKNAITKIKNPMTYIPQRNLFCTWSVGIVPPCRASSEISTIQKDLNNITYRYNLFIWQSWDVLAEGTADLTINISNINCPDSGIATAEISVTGAQIEQPSTIGQVLATIVIDWDVLQSEIGKIRSVEIDGRDEYTSKLYDLIRAYNRALKSRFIKESSPSIYKMKERLYPVEHKILISRLQRALNAYQFDATRARFVLTDKIKTNYQLDGQQLESNISFVVNTFPEAASKSAIVYEITYEPIVDRFTNKTVFGEEDILKYFNQHIRMIEILLR